MDPFKEPLEDPFKSTPNFRKLQYQKRRHQGGQSRFSTAPTSAHPEGRSCHINIILINNNINNINKNNN